MIVVSNFAERDMKKFTANYKECEDYMKPIRADFKRRHEFIKKGESNGRSVIQSR